MTDTGDQPGTTPGPPPPPPPPHLAPPPPPQLAPPPPFAPPAAGRPAFAVNHPPPGRVVDVDPASAGLVRVEKLGWAVVAAGIGTALMVSSLFFAWVETGLFVSYGSDVDGPLKNREETAGIFSAVDTVKDVVGPDPDSSAPGDLANLFFPWLAILLTVICCALALGAARGLRRAARTNTLRIVAVAVALAAVAVVVFAFISLGMGADGAQAIGTPVAPGPEPGAPAGAPPAFIAGDVDVQAGFSLWLLGIFLLVLAGALGPRVVLRLAAAGPVDPAYAGAVGTSALASSEHQAPRGLVSYTTQTTALVCSSLAAVLCVAGFGLLTWSTSGETVTFGEIGEAARDAGAGDLSFAGVYFAWLGWVVLLWVCIAAMLVALGKRRGGVSAKTLRPMLALVTLAAGVAHAAALLELTNAGVDLGAGALAASLGLVLAVIGTLLPLRVTARVLVG